MFHTIKRLVEDLRAIKLATADKEGVVAFLGADDTDLRERWVRLGMQVVLSFGAVAICVVVILNPTMGDRAVELAHTGLGTVLGYWLR